MGVYGEPLGNFSGLWMYTHMFLDFAADQGMLLDAAMSRQEGHLERYLACHFLVGLENSRLIT